MASGRKQIKKQQLATKPDKDVYNFNENEDENKERNCSKENSRAEETGKGHKMGKKRPSSDFDMEDATCPVGNEVQYMLEKFGADISKVMQAKKKRLESLTNNYMKGSQNKLEQLWSNYHNQRQKITQQYSQQVSAALQQWETEAQRAERQEEEFNNLFRQQQKILQQARVAQNQKLKTVKELYEQFTKTIEDMEKSQEAFLQGAHQELRKEMATLQKKILMDMQHQEMATVRKSLHSMLF